MRNKWNPGNCSVWEFILMKCEENNTPTRGAASASIASLAGSFQFPRSITPPVPPQRLSNMWNRVRDKGNIRSKNYWNFASHPGLCPPFYSGMFFKNFKALHETEHFSDTCLDGNSWSSKVHLGTWCMFEISSRPHSCSRSYFVACHKLEGEKKQHSKKNYANMRDNSFGEKNIFQVNFWCPGDLVNFPFGMIFKWIFWGMCPYFFPPGRFFKWGKSKQNRGAKPCGGSV